MSEYLPGIAKRTVIYGVGNAVNRFLGLITLPVFTAYLGPGEFGVIAVLVIFGLVCRPVFGLGLGVSTGIVYFDHQADEERGTVIVTALVLMAASGAVLVAAALAVAEPFARLLFDRDGLANLVVLQGVAIALQLAAEPLLSRLQFENRAAVYVVATFGGAVLGVSASLALVALLGRGVEGWVEGQVVHGGATLALTAIVVGRRLPARLNRGIAHQLLRLGAPLIPSFGLLYVMQYASHHLLRLFSGLEPLGVYSVGFNIGLAMTLVTSAFGSAWFPFFQSYSRRHEDAAMIFPRVALAYCLGSGLLCFGLFALARPAVMILTTPEFHAAYRVLGPIALAQWLLGLWGLLLPGMYFAKETHLVPLVQAGAAAVTVASGAALIPAFGIDGAAFAVVVGAASLVALQCVVNASRRYTVTVYDWRRLGGVVAALAGAALVQRMLDGSLPLAAALTGSIVLLALYLALAWGMLSRAERTALGRWVRQWMVSRV